MARWLRALGLGVCLLPGLVLQACTPPPARLRSPEIDAGRVVFRYHDPAAQVVQVAGSWETNFGLRGRDWTSNTRVGVMERADDGTWELQVPLGPGRYTYLFLVDGRFWELDPANPQREVDGHGSSVSLLVVP